MARTCGQRAGRALTKSPPTIGLVGTVPVGGQEPVEPLRAKPPGRAFIRSTSRASAPASAPTTMIKSLCISSIRPQDEFLHRLREALIIAARGHRVRRLLHLRTAIAHGNREATLVKHQDVIRHVPNGGDLAAAMPRIRLSYRTSPSIGWGIVHLMQLKKIWGVSLAPMTYRLHKLDLLSEWHYRKLYIEISSRGFRKEEPDGGPREISQVLQKVFAALRKEGVSKEEIAEALRVHPKDIDELVFGLALTSLNGVPARKRQ